MSISIDYKTLASQVVAALKPYYEHGSTSYAGMTRKIDTLEQRTRQTLESINTETDPTRRQALAQDLEKWLPAWREQILLQATTEIASDVQAGFEAALAVVMKVLVALGKAVLAAV